MKKELIKYIVCLVVGFFIGGMIGVSGSNIKETITKTELITVEPKTIISTLTIDGGGKETITKEITKTITKTKEATITESITITSKKGTFTQKEKEYVFLKEFSGKTDKTTESFYIPSSEWRIKWEYEGSEYANFHFFVYEKETGDMITSVDGGEGASGSDITYIYVGGGEYYIEVSAYELEYWKIIIEVLKEE